MFRGSSMSCRTYDEWRNLLFFESTDDLASRAIPDDVKAHWGVSVDQICRHLTVLSEGKQRVPWKKLLVHPDATHALKSVPGLSKDPHFLRNTICGAIKRHCHDHPLLNRRGGVTNDTPLKYGITKDDLKNLYKWGDDDLSLV